MGLKKFFKKNLRDIATVIGFAVGGPAGAAIGQGIGSVGEGRSLKDSLISSAKVYGGASIAQGAGLQGGQGFGQGTAGTGISFGDPITGSGGIGGFFEDVGASTRDMFSGKGAKYGSKDLMGTFDDLNFLQKGAVMGLGTAAVMRGGTGDDEEAVMSGPIDQSGYLTRGLTPAQLSDVYGTKGSGTGITGSMPSLEQSYDYDPVNSSIAELLKQQDEYELEFPEFARVGMNRGGALGMSPAIQMGTDIQQLQPIMNDMSQPPPVQMLKPFPSLSQPFQQRRGAQGDVMSALRPVGDFIKDRLNTDEVDSTLQEFAQTIESKFPDNNGGGMQGGFQNMYGGPGQGNGIGQLKQISNTDQGMDRDNFNIQSNDVARLADGGQMPTQDLDLREHGGDIDDPEGSGDEDTVPALLADGEFVMTKQAVAGIGDGDHDKGIAQLYAMMGMNENKAQTMGIGRA